MTEEKPQVVSTAQAMFMNAICSKCGHRFLRATMKTIEEHYEVCKAKVKDLKKESTNG